MCKKVKIISGEHKGKIGEVKNNFWASGICIIKLEDGEEVDVRHNEIEQCKEYMDFWSLSVKSTVLINGKDVAFDYNNTYYELNMAIKEAKLLSLDGDILEVSVHHWLLLDDGTEEHAEFGDGTDIPFKYVNKNHREFKSSKENKIDK